MGINLGKWSDAENGLLLAGASNDIIMKRTGRSRFAVLSARSKLGMSLGHRIKPIPDGLFLAQERAKLRELKKAKNQKPEPPAVTRPSSRTDISPVETGRPKKIIDLDKMRQERDWKPLESGAGVVCLKNDLGTPPKKIILRDNIVKYNGNPSEPVDPKTIHEGERKVFERVVPEPLDPKLNEAIAKMDGIDQLIETQKDYDRTPSKDELFFDINGTRVTVAAGTKKVDVTPYGLIIEF